MNLMFWKKKNGDSTEAENAQESLASNKREQPDFKAEKQDSATRNTKPSEQDTQEATEKPGLAEQIRLWLYTFTQRFRKTSISLKTPAKPDLLLRVKTTFITLIQRFKISASSKDKEHDDAPDAKPVRSRKRLMVGGAIGLLLLTGIIVAILFILTPPINHSVTRHDTTSDTSHIAQPESAPEKLQPEIKALKIEPNGHGNNATPDDETRHVPPPIPAPQAGEGANESLREIHVKPENQAEVGTPKTENAQLQTIKNERAEIEALKMKNAELQARIESLKDKLQQPHDTPVAPPLKKDSKDSTFPIRSEMTVGSEDPKATAMTLKKAIEAMNASSVDNKKKPAK